MVSRLVFTLDRVARFLSIVSAVGAGLVLMAMIIHVLAEIVLRSFFMSTTYVLEEMIGYGIAAMSFLGLGYALNEGALIRMNLLLLKLGNTQTRRVVEIICVGAALTFTCIASWYFYVNAVRDFMRGYVSETFSETPLWLPPSIMLVGMIVFVLQLTTYLLRVLIGDVSFAGESKSDF